MRRLLLCSCMLATAIGCKKAASEPTTTPASTADAGPAAAPEVPQEPDPPELAKARELYALGKYADAVAALGPIYADLKARDQYRAGGLAGGWLALAQARDVVEQAKEPAAHATAMADKTHDPEVAAVAHLATGAVRMGLEDFDTAIDHFRAATRSPVSIDAALGELLHAEALLGRAYGGGDGQALQRPQDLEGARQAYRHAVELAKRTDAPDVLIGRAEEGLAAVAKYQGRSGEICPHATEARSRYESAGASDYLKEGPRLLAEEAKCS